MAGGPGYTPHQGGGPPHGGPFGGGSSGGGPARGGPLSPPGSVAGVAAVGPGPAPQGQNPFGPSVGYDPARLSAPAPTQSLITNTRVELPSAAYALDRSGGAPVSYSFSFVNVLA